MSRDDDAPLSSYSDPFYDRLDAMARQVRRLWWLFALVIIIIALSTAAVHLWSQRQPAAAGAALAVEAMQERDDAKRNELWTKLADGADYAPALRANACIALTQAAILKGDNAQARKRAEESETLAKQANDDDLRFAAALSRAAVVLDGGDANDALDRYNKVATAAGQLFPARKFEADLEAARCLEKLNKIDDAILRLEPLTTRTGEGVEQLKQIAQAAYWRLKRTKLGEPPPVTKTEPAAAPKVEPSVPAMLKKPEPTAEMRAPTPATPPASATAASATAAPAH